MKTKNFLFKLMVCFMSLIPANAWGWHLSKVIRINPGDTICSSQLTERTHEMDNGSHIEHKDLIIIKNGGDFVLKIDSLNPMSYPADENNCIVVSGTHRLLFTFEKLNGQEFTLDVVVNYHGTLFLDGVELQQHECIVINNDEDAKKVISFSQDGKIHFKINWWVISTSKFDLSEGVEIATNLYQTSLGELIESCKNYVHEPTDSLYVEIIFEDGNGMMLYNPPKDDRLVVASLDGQTYMETGRSRIIFTIKDTRPTTGIHNASIGESQKEPVIFDLQGRRVRDPQPGLIYIINGKKIICR